MKRKDDKIEKCYMPTVWRTFITILFMCLTALLHAQEQKAENDAGLWIYAELSRKHGAKWKTFYSIEYRNKKRFSRTSLWSTAVNATRTLTSYMQAGAGVEFFMNKNDDGSFSPEYRYYPEITVSYVFGALSASLRSRVMNTFTSLNSPNLEWRNRLKTAFALGHSGLSPFIAAEPYTAFYPKTYLFRKIRCSAGASYAFAVNQKVNLYYMRETYFHKPLKNHVIQIEYFYTFQL
ncbi:MAG: DUF2490 domain-containing protein [Prevotellaceae bacterium]|nr:DUF2490 domain-containing protein [Prevotellaceae bacterium]